MEKICDLDCFNCSYPDCIREVKEKKTYPNYQSHKDWLRTRYYRWKSAGLCVRCGQRQATRGVHCIDCFLKRKRYDKSRNNKGLREYWRENGLCVCCGDKVVEGKKTCKKHYEIFAKCAEKSRNTPNARNYRERAKRFKYGKD